MRHYTHNDPRGHHSLAFTNPSLTLYNMPIDADTNIPRQNENEATPYPTDEWKDAAVTNKDGKLISVWRSNYADLETLGTGIGLWFRTLKAMALYFTIMSIPMCVILTHYLYLYYNPESDLAGDTMEALARFTTGVAATTTQDNTIAGWDVRSVMLAISGVDCFVVSVFLLLVVYLRRRQNAYIQENDDAVISLPDYTVEVGFGGWGTGRFPAT